MHSTRRCSAKRCVSYKICKLQDVQLQDVSPTRCVRYKMCHLHEVEACPIKPVLSNLVFAISRHSIETLKFLSLLPLIDGVFCVEGTWIFKFICSKTMILQERENKDTLDKVFRYKICQLKGMSAKRCVRYKARLLKDMSATRYDRYKTCQLQEVSVTRCSDIRCVS